VSVSTQARDALVVAAHGRRGLLELPDGRSTPYLVRNRRLKVVCGDRVHWSLPAGSDTAVVEDLAARRNQLRRQSAGRGETELLAANLTHLAAVIAPQPEPDLFLVDRYLCAAELMGCNAAVITNKCDLGPFAQAELAVISTLGYPVIRTSSHSSTGLAELAAWLGGGIGILVGQSGAGKSSLLNALAPSARLATGTLSTATQLGRHTTTASAMHRLANVGRLIDTPGVRGFIPAIDDPRSVQDGFREIAAAAARCRFADCSHCDEPDCAVKAAVGSGAIDERRYYSYRQVLADAQRLSGRIRS
jgi:ribosome biogenesis GTPase / thiamine phosphate phosphatase